MHLSFVSSAQEPTGGTGRAMLPLAQKNGEKPISRSSTSRALLLLSVLLLAFAYTCLTLWGSWDFLIDGTRVVRLSSANKAPLFADGPGVPSQPTSLPDDWRNSAHGTKAWRYSFVFELPSNATSDLEIYLPRVGDNAQVHVNGRALPHVGDLLDTPQLFWSQPLSFFVPPEVLWQGRNELLVDVYANERLRGSLLSVYIGPRGAFDEHRFAVLATKRSLAYVLMGLDLFAALAFLVYAASVSGRFYIASVGICLSMLGGIAPHLVDVLSFSYSQLICWTVVSFLILQSFCVYLCELLFFIKPSHLRFIYSVNGFNIFFHLSLPYLLQDHEQLTRFLIYPNLLTQVTGLLGTYLLARRFLAYGEVAVGLMLCFAVSISCLAMRDFLVLWAWLPSYHGFYSLHGVAVMLFCLACLVGLRIRAAYREQDYYQSAMREVRQATRETIKQSDHRQQEFELDELVSRIATTYSHEFRNPLAASLATNKIMLKYPWGR
ncbi:MAG: hypothetical protein ACPGSC_08615, partial [Granulosicoccaceae bacterium]